MTDLKPALFTTTTTTLTTLVVRTLDGVATSFQLERDHALDLLAHLDDPNYTMIILDEGSKKPTAYIPVRSIASAHLY